VTSSLAAFEAAMRVIIDASDKSYMRARERENMKIKEILYIYPSKRSIHSLLRRAVANG